VNAAGGTRILRGILLLARGKAAGIANFGNTTEALTAAIAPLIAFPLVGSVINGLNGAPLTAIIGFLSRLCAVLAVTAATHQFARLTKRESLWIRTATALNWSFWIIVPLLGIAGLAGAIMVSAGLPLPTAEDILIGLMAAYLLWYAAFTIRAGLQLNIPKSLLLVAIAATLIIFLTIAPDMLTLAWQTHGHLY
jgi:hypothetical protein